MIKVVYQAEEGKIYLKVSGHASSAPHGQDLICASVSSITTGALNALENPPSFKIVAREGLLELTSLSQPTNHDSIVLRTMLTQLETIAESYPHYINISRKGK